MSDSRTGTAVSVVANPDENVITFGDGDGQFDRSKPGFGKVFTYYGNTLVQGKIPDGVYIIVFDGILRVAAESIGKGVRFVTDSSTGAAYDQQLEAWQGAAAAGNTTESDGDQYYGIDQGGRSQRIKIQPGDILILMDWSTDRSQVDTAFEGEGFGLRMDVNSIGRVLFSGNTPPLATIQSILGCWVNGTLGAVNLLNIGGDKEGVTVAEVGEVCTITALGKIVTGSIARDAVLSSSGGVELWGEDGLGPRSIVCTSGQVTLPAKLWASLSEPEQRRLLQRLQTKEGVRVGDELVLSGPADGALQIEAASKPGEET